MLQTKIVQIKFPTKTQQMHISIFPRSGIRELQGQPFLKYYNVLEWESKRTLGLNIAKNTDYINFCLNHFLK